MKRISTSLSVLGLIFYVCALLSCSHPAQNSSVTVDTSHVKALYEKNCASCHGTDRMGLTGPALFAENLERLKQKDAKDVITNGRKNTQMAGFKDKLNETEINQLVEYVYAPVTPSPSWTLEQIKASQNLVKFTEPLSDKPKFKADPMNLFFVVELGDHAITVLDGDKFEPIKRFKTRFALHGGIKYSHDGRYAFWTTRDGWITKFDVYNLEVVAEVRAGINTRNIALSSDGRYVMVGNFLPRTLVALDARDLSPVKVIDVKDINGVSSRVSAVYVAPPRESFIVALKDAPEVWEVYYKDGAKAPPKGLVHDYKPESGELSDTNKELFPIRPIRIENALDDFYFDKNYDHILGAARGQKKALVVNLIVGRTTAQVDVQGMPHLASGISFDYKGSRVMASPNLADTSISVIDTNSWKIVKSVKTLGPGFFMRSHEKSRYAFSDVFFGKDKDTIQVFDKKKLEFVKELKPAPGKTAAHCEFTKNGRYSLISIWEDDGAIVVYDSKTLKEVKRIAMKKPSGKYNIWNKTHFDEGTSH